ncbi:MAG: EF-P lysine aminoacylase EpmA [Hyphomonadaceae bacterium]
MAGNRIMMTPWWDKGRHIDRRPYLIARSRIRAAIRAWFEGEGFVEVECGALQASPGNEAHLHAFETRFYPESGPEAGDPGRRLYLHTSPEFACKKLLAAGEARIFDFARAYRNRETGPLHSPEFTMLEWYRAYAPWDAVIADTLEIARQAVWVIGSPYLRWRNVACDPALEPDRLTLTEAFARYTGIVLPLVLDDRDAFAAAVADIGMRTTANDSWSDIFSRVLVERIEPKLGQGRLTVLCEYPASEAALARPLPSDPRFAERFELYACGVELANGFGELTDPDEQRRRFEAEMDLKQRTYGERYPLDEEFLAALGRMPPASGVALGFDRLVMLASGARTISDVLWTPWPGA